MESKLMIITALSLFWLPLDVNSHFWLLRSQVFSVGSTVGCNNIAGLVTTQKALCRRYPKLMLSVGKGAKVALDECQAQFANERWNCSVVDGRTSILGKLMSRGNRESAFFYAISSAGVVYEVTRACSQGELGEECTCDRSLAGQRTNRFEWYGCDDNIKFGADFAQAFFDAREKANDARSLMNKHNNKAGRKTVERHMELDCKCHGVSGSCAVKTCRRSLPSLKKIGDDLHEKYNGAVLVSLEQSNNGKPRLTVAINVHKPPTSYDLVYMESSPDYCKYDPELGTLGTAGRECNKTSDGSDGCGIMCCGLGFNTKQVEEEYNCDCNFIWCCKVKCRKCKRIVEKHYCKGAENVQAHSGITREERKKMKKERRLRKKKLRRQRKNRKRKYRMKNSELPLILNRLR